LLPSILFGLLFSIAQSAIRNPGFAIHEVGGTVLALKTSTQTVERFAFSADGKYLAAAGTGYKVHLWDLTAKKLKAKALPTFNAPTEWIGFLPDGRLFALSRMGQYATHDPAAGTTAKKALRRWWVGTIVAETDRSAFYGTGWQFRKWMFNGLLREQWEHRVSEQTLFGRGGAVLTPEGVLVAAVTEGGDKTWLHTRATATGARQRDPQLVAHSLIRDLTLLSDGRTLAFVRERQWKGKTANAVMLGTIGGKFEPLLTAKGKSAKTFSALALHPSGLWLAVGQFDGLVRIFDATTWCETAAYQWPVESLQALAFAPDGLKAAAGGANGAVVVWDVDL
jgi:WD40 repeat protein